METRVDNTERRRRWPGVVIAVGLIAVLAGGGWYAELSGLPGRISAVLQPTTPASAATSSAIRTDTATVVRTDVTQQEQLSGTLGYGTEMQINGQLSGVATWLPAPGTIVKRGQTIAEISGRPVPLLYGRRPAWRGFEAGMTSGSDVEQLERNLRALGHDPDHEMTIDETFDWATTAAIQRLQKKLGVSYNERDGKLQLGQVLFWPSAPRITSMLAHAGDPVQPGVGLFEATTTERVVQVALDTDRQGSVARGDRVQITLPSGETTPGRVSSVGRVAESSSSGNSGEQGDSESSDPTSATISVVVTLLEPKTAGNLDRAPVLVAITNEVHTDVLAVPVSALLARAKGGYEVIVGNRHIKVEPGLYDEMSGLLEVSGAGLSAGMKVEVPLS